MNNQPLVQTSFPDLPEGTVTFLFTDIEGSTQLLHRLKDKYAILLEDHHRILREVFSNWDGHEVDTQGDAFFVAFSRATQAVGAAAEAQRKLTEHIWPERVPVRVRMGIHTGESWTGSEGYVGMDVHRAARIAHVGNGGQVLLSETTTALVQNELPQGVTLLDLGRHLLKDIHRPEHIHQLVIERLEADFPPLASLEMLPPESARPKRKVGVCPYRGLSAFQEADAQFYFGREAFVDTLEQAVTTRKLVAVVLGSSGSGKSSAIFAGLLPRLRRVEGYQFAIFRPGSQPFYSLAGALVPLLEPNLSRTDRLTETGKLADQLRRSKEVHLHLVIQDIKAHMPKTRHVLLVIDQFEELYTLCTEADLQKAFIDELLLTVEASKAQRGGLAVILLTMRADFMGQALTHRTFADALQEAALMLGPMTRAELHTAIEKPAEMQGAAFEPGLIERILDDVGQKPGNLPLLEFTLTQLWERHSDGWLTHSAYEAMGGVEGALASYADQVYDELDEAEQNLARRSLVQLVQPGEGTEDTRRIATRDELGDESWNLIQYLANKRLVVTGRDAQGQETVEVAHEALIQKWGRFREWMDMDRDFRTWQERLRGSLRQWQQSGNDKGSLLAGVSLAVSLGWLAERSRDLSRSEMEYIAASQVEQRTLQEAEIAREKREIALTRRSRNFLYALVIILLLAVIGASGLTYLARQAQAEAEQQSMARATQQVLAEQQADLASARELALAAIFERDIDPELSILLGLQSASIYTSLGQTLPNDLQSSLHQAIQASRVRMTWEAGSNSILSVGFIQPGDLPYVLANDSDNHLVTLWDPIENRNWFEVPVTQGKRISASLNKDGTILAISENDTIRIIDIKTGQEQKRLSPYPGEISEIIFNPDRRSILSLGHPLYVLREIDSDTLKLQGSSLERGSELAVAFSMDGKQLAIRTSGDTVSIFDTFTGDVLSTIQLSPDMDIIALAFNPDGTRLAGAGRVERYPIWNVQTGELLLSIEATHGFVSGGGQVETLAFSPDGKRLALPGVIYDALTGEELFSIPGHKKGLLNLAFNSDGTRLITASRDSTVKMWDLTPSKEVLTLSHPSGEWIYDVAFSPDGKWLVTTGADKTARVWELNSGNLIQVLEGHTDTVNSVAFSPDGTLIATGSADLSVRIWDTKSWKLARVLTGHRADLPGTIPVLRGVSAVAFSPHCSSNPNAGKNCHIAGVGMDGQLIIWDALTGQNHFVYQDPQGSLKSIAYSENGKLLAIGTTGMHSNPVGVTIVFDSSNGEIINTYLGKARSWSWDVAFSPDGNKLATIDFFGEIKYWNLETNELLLSVAQNGSGNSIAFDQTGSYLATAGTILTVRDAQTGEQLFDLPGHTAPVIFSLAFSQDGKYLASGALDGTARVYVIPLDDLLAFARSRLTRSLTTEECQKYLHVETCPQVGLP